MQMLCPECMGPLEMIDAGRARCTLHGGQYRVLFSRWVPAQPVFAPKAEPAGNPPAESGTVIGTCPSCGHKWRAMAEHVGKTARCSKCQTTFPIQRPQTEPEVHVVAEFCGKHPEVKADHSCRGCGTPICNTCTFVQPNGERLCPDCAVAARRTVPPVMPDFSLQGKQCVNHPGVAAACFCRSCDAPVCETCTFKFPGNVHVCPSCAASPRTELGARQTKYLVGSFVCAVVATLLVAFTFFLLPQQQTQKEAEVIGTVVVFAVIGLSIAGTALSTAARIPRQPTPVGVWVALAWNVMLLAGMVLLCLAGALMGA